MSVILRLKTSEFEDVKYAVLKIISQNLEGS